MVCADWVPDWNREVYVVLGYEQRGLKRCTLGLRSIFSLQFNSVNIHCVAEVVALVKRKQVCFVGEIEFKFMNL